MALALAVVVAGGCTKGDDAAGPTAAPSTEGGEGLPPLTPVQGERRPSAPPIANQIVLGIGNVPEMDGEAVLRLAHQVGDWLDRHLNQLQRGKGGRLRGVAAPGLMDRADPAAVQAVTRGLATRRNPVEKAVYELRVAQAGAPHWVTAEVTVTQHAGAVVTAVFTFVPTPDGNVQLIAFGPGEDAPQPQPAPASPAGTP